MKVEFDTKGNLNPYEKITIGIDDFEQNFVNDFENSTSRRVIFEQYLRFIEDL
jgi:hypothetical protein